MPSPSLSLCMVVRDEEDRLAACLRPLRSAVDEIIVVDTGSRDRTPEIARALGGRVLRRRWRDDFRAPRAASFRAARGDWILVLDADERIDGRRVRSLLREGVDAWRFAQRIPSRAWGLFQEGAPGASEVRVVRLFRNLPGLRCADRVHADVEPWLASRRRIVRDAPFPIIHLQDQRPEAMRRRQVRYLRMSLKQAFESPRDARVLRDLGTLLFSVRGDARGALRRLDAALRLAPRDALAHGVRGAVLLALGRKAEAASAFRRSRGRDARRLLALATR